MTNTSTTTTGGWHPDPWQRSQYRYFDGQSWTANVSTNGVAAVDAEALTMPTPPAVPAPPPAFSPGPAPAPVNVIIQAPKKSHRLRWFVLGAFALIVVGGLAAAAGGGKTKDDKPSATTAAGNSASTVSKGAGARDASADVTGMTLAAPDAIGIRYVTVTVTNNSSKRSNYMIEVAIESADGKTQIDTTSVFVSNLEPGQTTEGKSPMTTENVPADAKLSLKSVTRLAA